MKQFFTLVFLFAAAPLLAQLPDTWSQVGMVKFPENPSVQTTGMGRVSELLYHPSDSNILFAVSASGGLWRSSNEGQSWTSLTDMLPRTACASLCINRLNPKVMYLGTGDANYNSNGMGVWKSHDAGKTWFQSNTGMGNKLVSHILMHPSDTNVLIAACSDGIYKSYDRGNTWTKKTSVNSSYRDLVYKANAGTRYLYAASDQYFYRSSDLGENWVQSTVTAAAAGIKIGVSPADSQQLYCVVWSNGSNKFGGLYRSVDDGANFTLQSSSPNILGYSADGSTQDGQGSYNLCIAVDPANINTIYVGAINIWKSVDAGQSWTLKSHWGTGVHADKHHFLFSPYNKNKLYLSHDGGLDRSSNGGDKWTTLSDGLSASEFYKMGQSILRKEILIGGLQDNGLNLYRNGTFYTIRGGDWTGDFVFDHKDTNILYFNGGNRKFINAGEETVNGSGLYLLHPTDTNVLFYGTTSLYRSTNLKTKPSSNVSYTQVSSVGGGANVRALACSRSNPNVLYMAFDNGELYRSDNILSASPTYTLLSTKPTGTVGQIILHGKDSQFVMIVIGSKIYRSSDKGQTWWNKSLNLPALNIVKAIVDENTADTVTYVANALGIYYNRRFMSGWNSFSASLPTIAPISDMELYKDTLNNGNSRLRISTYGRGIWQSNLFSAITPAPQADFKVMQVSSVCSGYYMFNDISTGSPTQRRWRISPLSGWSYVNGTDSTSRVPEIRFNTAGNYVVTLLVSNLQGSSMKHESLIFTNLPVGATCAPAVSNIGNYTIGIYRFELNGIDKSSNFSTFTSPGIEDFSCSDNTTLRPGASYTGYITNGTAYNENARVYIDFNNNGSFESTEQVGSFSNGQGRRSASISIPSTVPVAGTYLRLRVISDYNTVTGPCANLTYGQAEDYAVMIDTLRPVIQITVPKPQVSKDFTATFTLNKYVTDFDASDVQVINGALSNFTQTGPFTYTALISPQFNGAVTLNISVGRVTDKAGNSNRFATESTNFFLGLSSFTFPGISISDSLITQPVGGLVKVKVPFGTRLDSLIARFSTSDNLPAYVGGVLQKSDSNTNNFSTQLVYTIESSDLSHTSDWIVQVEVQKNKACSLLGFALSNPTVSASITGATVQLTVPFGTNRSALQPVFTLSDSAKAYIGNILQQSGFSSNNYTSPVIYHIVAHDTAYTCNYTVTVSEGLSSSCDMLSYAIAAPPVNGVITPDASGGMVKVSLPFGTPLGALQANFTLSDSARARINNVLQQSGVSVNNYADTLRYEVSAQNGLNKKTYKVIASVQPNTACDLLSFAIKNPAATGSINGLKVSVTVPFGTNLGNLQALFTVSDSARVKIGSVFQQSGISSNDFSSTLLYQVIAQSGLQSKTYEVTVKQAPNSACELLSYKLQNPQVTGTITPSGNGGTVNLLVSPALNLNNLVAEFQLSDSAYATVAGITQQSGLSGNNYNQPFTFTVHAQDAVHTKDYTITVTPNTGLSLQESQSGWLLYPNPGDGLFKLQYLTPVTGETYRLNIYDMMGRLIRTENLAPAVRGEVYELDMRYLAKGVYQVNIFGAGATWMQHLLIE